MLIIFILIIVLVMLVIVPMLVILMILVNVLFPKFGGGEQPYFSNHANIYKAMFVD
jgi:flagellar basal body-associated protein FliL